MKGSGVGRSRLRAPTDSIVASPGGARLQRSVTSGSSPSRVVSASLAMARDNSHEDQWLRLVQESDSTVAALKDFLAASEKAGTIVNVECVSSEGMSRRSAVHYASMNRGPHALAILTYLVDVLGLPLTATSSDGMSVLHTACAFGSNVEVVRWLMEERGFRHMPSEKREADDIFGKLATDDLGNNALHHACSNNGRSIEAVIGYLVRVQRMDPLCKSMQGFNAIHKLCRTKRATPELLECLFDHRSNKEWWEERREAKEEEEEAARAMESLTEMLEKQVVNVQVEEEEEEGEEVEEPEEEDDEEEEEEEEEEEKEEEEKSKKGEEKGESGDGHQGDRENNAATASQEPESVSREEEEEGEEEEDLEEDEEEEEDEELEAEEDSSKTNLTADKQGTEARHSRVLDTLVEVEYSGLNRRFHPDQGLTPLMLVARHSLNVAVGKWLLEHGATLDMQSKAGDTAAILACGSRIGSTKQVVAFLHMLLEFRVDLTLRNKRNQSALIQAILRSDEVLARWLVAHIRQVLLARVGKKEEEREGKGVVDEESETKRLKERAGFVMEAIITACSRPNLGVLLALADGIPRLLPATLAIDLNQQVLSSPQHNTPINELAGAVRSEKELDCIIWLLQCGADPRILNNAKENAAHRLVQRYRDSGSLAHCSKKVLLLLVLFWVNHKVDLWHEKNNFGDSVMDLLQQSHPSSALLRLVKCKSREAAMEKFGDQLAAFVASRQSYIGKSVRQHELWLEELGKAEKEDTA